MIPVSVPFSQWSHQRSASCRKPIAGPGQPVVRVEVPPRADQALPRPLVAGQEAQDRVRVAVGPAADHVDRAADRAVVLADRALLPELVAALVREPRLDEGRRLLEALEPLLAPALPDHSRVGRARVEREHRRGPGEHVGAEDAAAEVVDVVGVAVVGRADADHRLELGRRVGGDLERVEAAPRLADHADSACAPRLAGEPADHLDAVLLLARQVLVLEDVRRSRPSRAGRP